MKDLFALIGGSFLMFGIFVAIFMLVGACCWTYSLNTWLVFFGKQPVILWWHGALLGIVPFVGQASIPVAVVTWILMIFLV
jgi:hypothetical protein